MRARTPSRPEPYTRRMPVRVRFAPSPTGSLHLGNALSAVANRGFGDWMLLRIDDTDPARNIEGGEEAILRDLEWLGVDWDEGPVRQSDRAERHREAGAPLGDRFDGRDAPARGRLADLSARVGGRRHRLRNHARRPWQRPPSQRVAAPAHVRGARRDAAGVRPSRPDPRTGRPQAVKARTGRDGRVVAGGRDSRPRPYAPTSRSSGCRATTSTSTSHGCGGSRPRRSGR